MRQWTNVETSMPPPGGQAVPGRSEEVTPEWLTACLRHAGVLGPDAAVVALERARIGEGHGFAGRLARFQPRYEPPQPQAPASLIGKFATDHAPTREMMAAMDAYEREVRFYRELAPEIGVGTPRCYFAHYDRAGGHFFLLLEDLSPARSADIIEGLSFDQAKLVLEHISGLHARWWNRAHEQEWLAMSDALLETMRARFVGSVPRFVERFGAVYPEIARIASQLAELLSGDELLSGLQEPPLTLAHNDLHLDNVFLPTQAGGRFALIDWQGLGFSRHGTTDVARILCMGMRPEVRREHTEALLRHYHAALSRRGVRGYSMRKLRRRYREEMTAAVIIGVLAFDTLDFEVDGGQLAASTIGTRVDQAVRDAKVGSLLQMMVIVMRIRRFFARIFGRQKQLGPGSDRGA